MQEIPVKISIIIPSYNSEQTIRQCLDSTVREFSNGHEIIVVDDGATDNSPTIICDYPVKFVTNGKNSGAGAARNRGLEQASNDWVLFIDSDVVVKEGVYDILQQAIREFPDDVAFGSVSDVKPANPGIFQEFLACRAHFQYAHGPAECTAFPSQFIAVKKSVFDEVGKFSEEFVTAGGEEFEMGYRLSKNGICTRILPHFQFYHVYAGFWKRLNKFYSRSKIYYNLFKTRKTFETVIASRMETLRCLYTFGGLIGVLLFPSLSLLIPYLAIYLILDHKFLMFLVRRKGLLFAGYGAFANYFIFISIALGGLVAMVEDWVQKLSTTEKDPSC